MTSLVSENSTLYQIQENVTNHLVEVCEEAISINYITKGGTVKKGLLQDDPTQGTGINILVHVNDPNDSEWKHTTPEKAGIPGFDNDTIFEIGGCGGGSSLLVRRFLVELRCFYPRSVRRTKVTREDANRATHTIISRVEKGILEAPLPATPDDFGEVALQNFVHTTWAQEAGGEGSYQWYGYVRFQTMTVRE